MALTDITRSEVAKAIEEIPGAEALKLAPSLRGDKRVAVRFNLAARKASEEVKHEDYSSKFAASDNLKWSLSNDSVADNQQPLGKYDTVDLGASIDLNQRFSIQATVENVTNKLALTEGNIRAAGSGNTNGFFLGRPIFGRHATITAAYKF